MIIPLVGMTWFTIWKCIYIPNNFPYSSPRLPKVLCKKINKQILMAKTVRSKTLHDLPLTSPGYVLQPPLPPGSTLTLSSSHSGPWRLLTHPPCTSLGSMTLLMLLPSLWLREARSFLKSQFTHPLFHQALPDAFLDCLASGPLHLPLLRTLYPQIFAWLVASHNIDLSPKFTFWGRSPLTTSAKVANLSTFCPISLCVSFLIALTTVWNCSFCLSLFFHKIKNTGKVKVTATLYSVHPQHLVPGP